MWALFATTSAISVTARNLFSKHFLKGYSQHLVMWATFAGAVVFSGVAAAIAGMQIKDSMFWQILAIRLLIDTIAALTFTRALKLESVSYVIPMLGLIPVVSSIAGFLLSGQVLSQAAIIVIIVIVTATTGIFLTELRLDKSKKGLIEATVLILITVLCWGVLGPIHSRGMALSTTYTYFFISNIFFLIIFSAILVIFDRAGAKKLIKREVDPKIFLLGLLLGVEFLAQLLAYSTGLVGIVDSIKSSNAGLSAVAGWQLFKEKMTWVKMAFIVISLVAVVYLSVAG
jgi:drug/metabolite transporter (DMT)-like permease